MPLRHLIVLIVDAHPSAEARVRNAILDRSRPDGFDAFFEKTSFALSTMVRSAPNDRIERCRHLPHDPTVLPRYSRSMPYSRCHTAVHVPPETGMMEHAKQIFADKTLKTPRAFTQRSRAQTTLPSSSSRKEEWWSQTGSNRRPHACKARALPTELWPQ